MFGIINYIKTVINNIIYNNLDINNININNAILQIQNVSLLCICLTVLYTSFQYYPYITGQLDNSKLTTGNGPNLYSIISKVVVFHAIVDLFFLKSIDVIFHHFLILGFAIYGYYYKIDLDSIYYVLYYFLNVEISSIFYIFKYWIPEDTNIFIINGLFFYGTFFKYRIYDYYLHIIKKNLYIIIDKYSHSNYFLSGILITSTYGLFILNLYWFSILTKILFKMFWNKTFKPVFGYTINKGIISHYLCSYIHFINIPLSIYIYHYEFINNIENHIIKYLIDITGIVFLSAASYIYHNDIYKRLNSNVINSYIIPNKKNIIHYVDINVFIQLRSLLTLFISYYDTDLFIKVMVMTLSAIFHVSSLYNIIINILTFLFIYDFDEEYLKKYFIKIHRIISLIPVFIDILLIYINSSHSTGMSFLFINIFMCIIYCLEPLYEFTYFVLHLLFIAQTYYLCLSHIGL